MAADRAGNVTSRRWSFETELTEAGELLATDPAATLERASSLAAEKPDPRAFRLAAAALRALDRYDEAAKTELNAIKFGLMPPLQQAVKALESQHSKRSKAIADDYLRDNPDDLLAMTIAAEAGMRLRQAQIPEKLLRQVLDRAPGFPRAAYLLSNILASDQRMREAIGIMEELRTRLSTDPNTLRQLADLRAQRGDYCDAADLYGEVLATAGPDPADLFRYAHSLRAAGRSPESIDALRRAVDLAPLEGRAWWALAQYFPEQLNEKDFNHIRSALAQIEPGGSDAGLLQIALSILHHRRGEYEAAFKTVSSVKAARRPGVPYDADALSRYVDELTAAFTPELFSRRAPEGSDNAAPVFIIGMPRSGSTLVERILGCHSKIEGVGEIQVMPRLVSLEQDANAVDHKSVLPQSLSAEKLAEMAEWYLRRSDEFRRTEKPLFVDKYNANWIHAGLIRLMFPTAKILDVRRNAVDCCWSVFRTMFGDDYANNQRDLAHYYLDYVRYVEAVESASSGGILTVRYEDLIADLEGGTRKMLSFLNLEFEAACASFHLATSGVATPSSEQVRRPIYNDSLGISAPYLPWLGPMLNEFQSHGIVGADYSTN